MRVYLLVPSKMKTVHFHFQICQNCGSLLILFSSAVRDEKFSQITSTSIIIKKMSWSTATEMVFEIVRNIIVGLGLFVYSIKDL